MREYLLFLIFSHLTHELLWKPPDAYCTNNVESMVYTLGLSKMTDGAEQSLLHAI